MLDCGTGISNDTLGSVVVVVLSFPGCDCSLVLALISQRLVWYFLLHDLHCYLDWHCETLWWPKQLYCFGGSLYGQ